MIFPFACGQVQHAGGDVQLRGPRGKLWTVSFRGVQRLGFLGIRVSLIGDTLNVGFGFSVSDSYQNMEWGERLVCAREHVAASEATSTWVQLLFSQPTYVREAQPTKASHASQSSLSKP